MSPRRRRLSARGLSFSAGALSFAALSLAQAQEVPEEDLLPFEGMLLPRHNELTTEVVTHVALREGDAHLRIGLALEFVPWILRETPSTRVALYQSATFGSWGDGGLSELFTLEAGAKLRISLYPGDVVDLYPLIGASWLYDFRGPDHMGVKGIAGGGFRVFRAISGELTFEILSALGDADGRPNEPVFGVGTAVGFDFCSLVTWCDYAPLRQERDDQTCHLYREGNALCAAAGASPEARRPFCEAVEASLNPRTHPPEPGGDSPREFLDALVAELRARKSAIGPAADELVAKVGAITARHRCFSQWRAGGRDLERRAARGDRVVKVRRVYAPYPTELKRAFGCGQQAVCEDVCDEQPSRPMACGAAR
jgi:hypothetical protein